MFCMYIYISGFLIESFHKGNRNQQIEYSRIDMQASNVEKQARKDDEIIDTHGPKVSSSSTAWTYEEAEEFAQELNMQHPISSFTTWTYGEAEEFAQELNMQYIGSTSTPWTSAEAEEFAQELTASEQQQC